MNSPFATIYLAVQAQLKSAVSTLNYIDQDLGQLKNTRPPVMWPCILIDFEDFRFEDVACNVQTATGIIVIRLGFAPFSNTNQVTPSGSVTQALGYYDIEWSVHQALQGWSPGAAFGHLNRLSVTTQKRADNYRVREIRYSIAFEDYSTKPTQQYAPATLVVADEIDVSGT